MLTATCFGFGTRVACAQGTFASPPPVATSPQWRTWYNALLAQRIAEVPLARATTYHFSQAGSDTTGSGTIGSPFRTLVKAQQLITQHQAAGNIALLFRRGDTWREQVGLQSSTPNITIADYGDGALEKPKFTPFVSVGTPGAWAPVAEQPNVYSRTALPVGVSPGLPVLWVKQDDDRSRPYSRQQTLAGVAGAEGSFWFEVATGTLFIHPRHSAATGQATDPRSDGNDYQFIRRTGPGIIVRADGSRIENIFTEGWGMDTGTPTQQHGIDCAVGGTSRALVIGCESYYGSSHAITHYVGGGAGGIATFIGCRAGLCNYNGANSETVFNTFAAAGGSEAIFDSCVAAYGTLPSSEWDFNTTRRGQAFYGHTGGGAAVFRLVVMNNCRSEAGPRSTGMAAHFAGAVPFTNLEDCRGFIVGESHPGGPGTASLPIAGGSYVRMNGSYLNMIALAPPADQPSWSNPAMAGFPQVGWAINNLLDIDASARQWQYAMYNGPEGSPSSLKLIGNFIRVRTGTTTEFRIDYDEPNQSAAAAAYNNIFVKTGPGTARFNIGTGDGAGSPSVIGNAFFGFELTGVYSRYVNGARNMVLATEPAFGVPPSCGSPLLFAADPLPMGIKPGTDQVGWAGLRCTIGPIEASPCADVDGDGRLTSEDMYFWQRNQTDVNGDGRVDAADAELIERAIRWAESFAAGAGQNRGR